MQCLNMQCRTIDLLFLKNQLLSVIQGLGF
jgi:hypothetical protein